jgi:CheY-like chemotaxis protein
MSKLIYIVEDDSDIRDTFVEIMTELHDYEVMTAENGRVGIDKLKATSRLPDIILLDVLMPVLDGFGFRQEQLADPRLADIPIIVLSASHNITDLAHKMKAKAYLKKPIEIEDLINAVEEFT